MQILEAKVWGFKWNVHQWKHAGLNAVEKKRRGGGGMPVREHTQSILKVCHCVKIIIGKIYGKGVKLLLRKVLLDDERN